MTINKLTKLIILVLSLATFNVANASSDQPFSSADNLPLAASEVAEYIAGLKSVAIEFTQSDSHENVAHGMLVINKPYKFRCNYYEPFPLLIIGNKNYISMYDFEMKYIARIKTSENAFNFLLLDHIDFENEFEILQISDDKNEYLMKIRSHSEDKISEIVFDKKSRQLKKLTIFEDDNEITLTFGQNYIIEAAPSDLFILQNPDMFGPPARLSQEDLYKKLKIHK